MQEPPPLLLNSIIANVEATLTFTLASKLVDMTLSLQQQQSGSSTSNASNTNATWILGALCLMVLSISSTWKSSSSDDQEADVSAAQQDLISMLNQTLVLAFSRIVLMQVRKIR